MLAKHRFFSLFANIFGRDIPNLSHTEMLLYCSRSLYFYESRTNKISDRLQYQDCLFARFPDKSFRHIILIPNSFTLIKLSLRENLIRFFKLFQPYSFQKWDNSHFSRIHPYFSEFKSLLKLLLRFSSLRIN